MDDYIDRLEKELVEVGNRRLGLNRILQSEKFDDMDSQEQGLLLEQFEAMKQYHRILILRLQNHQATQSVRSDQSGRGSPMKNTRDSVNSSTAVNAESTDSPTNHAWTEAELGLHECESPHYGMPHTSDHEAEDEWKSRLSGQRIKRTKSRLMSGAENV